MGNAENAQKIKGTKKLLASRDTIKDARFGAGVYASPFEPLSKTRQDHILNNYGTDHTRGRDRYADWVVSFEVPEKYVFRIEGEQGKRVIYNIKMLGGKDLYLVAMSIEPAVCKA